MRLGLTDVHNVKGLKKVGKLDKCKTSRICEHGHSVMRPQTIETTMYNNVV